MCFLKAFSLIKPLLYLAAALKSHVLFKAGHKMEGFSKSPLQVPVITGEGSGLSLAPRRASVLEQKQRTFVNQRTHAPGPQVSGRVLGVLALPRHSKEVHRAFFLLSLGTVPSAPTLLLMSPAVLPH